jgi:hypothetical protein
VETEVICVGNPEMPFEDYVRARVADLLTVIFYNNKFSETSRRWLKKNDLSPWSYIERIIELKHTTAFASLLGKFKTDLEAELFDTNAELEILLERDDAFELLKSGELGKNLTSHYNSLALAIPRDIFEIASRAARDVGGNMFEKLVIADLSESIPALDTEDAADQYLARRLKVEKPKNNADLAMSQ